MELSMPITNVNQEPVNLQELLLVKSMPILSKMLGPKINGSNVNNYRVVDVEEINNETFVVIESTKDPLVDIDTATADQKVQRRIPYARHSIKSVFEHFLGAGPFRLTDIPSTVSAFNTFLADRGVDIVLDEDEIYFSAYQISNSTGSITISPKDPKDLKWKGVYHFNIERVFVGEGGEEVLPDVTVTNPSSPIINITDNESLELDSDDIHEIVVTLPDGYAPLSENQWSLDGGAPAGMTLNVVDELHAELIHDGVADGTYNVSVYFKYNSFVKSTPIQVTVTGEVS